jgi:alkanesulfonate monooxygenase SsuD/methylene tetrahydromethanopterin reductase-like flavin-dependent oxidoreductase (luciferase family)
MKLGLTLPIFDALADPGLLAELGEAAERAGWDGFFLWDHVYYRPPMQAVTDPWIALAAIATRTRRVALGPMVTPLARRRPHVVARQIVALDHLSAGRAVLGVGLGLDSSGGEFERFAEETDVGRRAQHFDEALGLLTALLSGGHVDHVGAHYRAADVRFLPTPLQEHLPIWVAARWPHRRPLRRAARHDGVFVIDLEPDDVPAAIAVIEAERPDLMRPYDVVVHDQAGADPHRWAHTGATWLLATFDPFAVTVDEVRSVIADGPPR